MLGPLRDLRRQQALHRLAVQPLPCTRAHAGARGNAFDKAHELDVEERDPLLEAGGHGHLVAADQQARGQEHARVEVEGLGQQVTVGHVGEQVGRLRGPLAFGLLTGPPREPRAQTRVADLHQPHQPLGVLHRAKQVAEPPRPFVGQLCGQARQRARQAGQRPEQGCRLVAPVAAVGLVGALAREDDLHVLGGEPGELEQRGGRRDPDRLLEPPHGAAELGQVVALDHRRVVVVGAEDSRALRRRLALVEHLAGAGEADREGLRGLLGGLRHRRHDRGRVHAAAEQRAVGNVGHHLALDRGGEVGGQLVGEIVLLDLRVRWSAKALDPRFAVRGGDEQLAWRELLHALEDRPRPRHEATGQVVVECHRVDLGLHQARCDEGPDLGGHGRPPSVGPPVDGLDPEGIARGDEAVLARVPQREAVHPVHVVEELEPGLLVAVDERLAVRAGREAVAGLLQALSEVQVVVDLAVCHQRDLAVLGEQRLVAAGHVDDRQAGADERRRAEALDRLAVGPAVAQGVRHTLTGVGGRGPGRVEQRCDAAHAATSSQ